MKPEGLTKFLDGSRRLEKIHKQHRKALLVKLLVQTLDDGQLPSAELSPTRPEIHKDHLPPD